MCSVLLVYSLLIIIVSAWLATKKLEKDTVLKAIVVPTVVVLAVFLVVAGYDDKQFAPVMGLFGTIIGYVLGSSRRDAEAGGQHGRQDD
jgi:hypothetical protein